MTVDWIEVKYALVRVTVRCIKLAMLLAMGAWAVMRCLIRSLMKGSSYER